MKSIDYQDLVWKLGNFIELRFGVYLDTVMGFQNNFEEFTKTQERTAQITQLSIEELDKVDIIYGDGPPSSDFEECRKRELHRRTQSEFKKHNSPEGINYDFAIENCLSDIFNYWNAVKEKMDFLDINEKIIFPITSYMRSLRNRVQHDLYPERVNKNAKIIAGKTQTSYSFPTFEHGQHIRLTEDDIKALILEARAQIALDLVPYINNFLQNQAVTKQ